MTPEAIIDAALALPAAARADLAERLFASLDDVEQRAIEETWGAEIDRRLDELDRGEVQAIPGEQVMNELRNRNRR